jgi:hypothetical protein
MNIVLWVLQVLLALVFLAHGLFLLIPPATMIEAMNATMSTSLRVFIGVAEVLGAVGLILPGLTRILPWLTYWAAAGIMMVMICATIFHAVRGEVSGVISTACLLAMATFVAYLRWKVRPILPRATT